MPRRLLLLAAAAAATLVVGGSSVALAGTEPAELAVRHLRLRQPTGVEPAPRRSRVPLRRHEQLLPDVQVAADGRRRVRDARGAGFNVVRTWGFLDIGNQDGSDSVRGIQEGVYFQYWDGQRPAYNDGADRPGEARLRALASARQHGIKLVIPLTNNWNDFGGMDQYVRWRDRSTDATEPGRTWYHDDFYTDPVIRGWYRTGSPRPQPHQHAHRRRVQGRSDRHDLGARQRAAVSERRRLRPLAQLHHADADHVGRRDDPPHQVGRPQAPGRAWATRASSATSPATRTGRATAARASTRVALAKLPAVDLMSFHIYPTAWGKDLPWTYEWITRHVREANAAGKPVMWGEFGWVDKATRNTVYKQWTDLFDNAGGDGWLYWILSGVQDDGTLYPDYDGYTVYCPSPVCTTLSNAGEELRGPQRSRPPVADHDTAVVEFNQTASLTPAANDVAYRTTSAAELDRPRPGHGRTAAHTRPGRWHVRPRRRRRGRRSRRPPTSSARRPPPTRSSDEAGRRSNVADISVTVKPDPTAAIPIATFETGTEGWAPGSWQPNAGTLTQTADFHPQGAYGLHLDVTAGHWFGRTFDDAIEPDRQGAGDLRASHRSQWHVGRAGPAGR